VRNAYKILVGRPESKIPLGRASCKRGENIKMDLKDIGYEGVTGVILLRIRPNCEYSNKLSGFHKRQGIS
jgi:hypothetical protein